MTDTSTPPLDKISNIDLDAPLTTRRFIDTICLLEQRLSRIEAELERMPLRGTTMCAYGGHSWEKIKGGWKCGHCGQLKKISCKGDAYYD